MLRNLAAVVSNYREGGISVFVLAYFVSSPDELRGIRDACGVPLREAARQIAAGQGVGIEDIALANDRPVPVVAEQIMTWLGWT